MALHDHTPLDQQSRPATARIDVTAVADDTLIVTLSGEHDLSTKAHVLDALRNTREEPNVVIDLTPCSFADSTIIATLLQASQSTTQRVSIVSPVESSVHRVLLLVGAHDLATIHASLTQALATLEPEAV